ncbi:hypothetical protein SARC_00201 [Sphaeroforma arctica JP610]|uniref:Uncharacterized protein n=1 Tax=Sphaeroforma arctica JP610 TaxID=667725 RepID=A0A0L0GFS4_9EUKA|nr:hypothetical protein SARC_00201 [Sphaeroforma arctica JP610]KNC87694.1 hypothetical protein SARC_00201 [Sphaeroforma arctica JP610]|eukprot:XP_014161596.1 hypothetical protein SARC_00201 [Sphaeroforma arctica JP610]
MLAPQFDTIPAARKTSLSDVAMTDIKRYRQVIESQSLKAARQKIVTLFQRPEQLEKVNEHRRNFAREKAAVDARSKSLAQSHAENLKQALKTLEFTRSTMSQISVDFEKIQERCSKSADSITDYDRIKDINRNRNHLFHTRSYLDNIFTALDIARTLDEELESEDCNLLAVHSRLSDLENCRDELIYYVQNDDENRNALEAYFGEVNEIALKLEDIIWDVLTNLIANLQARPHKVVSVLRIVEREEMIDRDVKEGNRKMDTSYRPKKYRMKALEAITNSIEKRYRELTVEGNVAQTVGNFRFIFQDLQIMKDKGTKCFPPTYDIFTFYLEFYHSKAVAEMKALSIRDDLVPGDIWLLLSYSDQYHDLMYSKVGIPRDRLAPPMLQGAGDNLMDDYVDKLSNNMQTWCKNIIITEWDEWFGGSREDPPDEDAAGLYISQVPVILFQMVDQQYNVAEQANSVPLRKKVLRRCSTILLDFQQQYEHAINNQGRLYFQGEGNNDYFLEYMMIIVNNCSKCELYTHELATAVKNKVGSGTENSQITALQNVLHGFMHIAAKAYRLLIEVAFGDLSPYFKKLFTKEWYSRQSDSGQAFATILVTLDDYCNDFKEHTTKKYFECMINEMHTRFLVSYATQMFTRATTVLNQETVDIMREEMDKSFEFFENLGADKVDAKQVVIISLAELSSCSEEFMALHYVDLVKNNPDFSIRHLEQLLTFRSDISRSSRAEIVKNLGDTPVRNQTTKPVIPNFFGNIRLPPR